MSELKIKIKLEKEDDVRKDPTSFLPEEAMTYEIKKKKKKKKKKMEDPFKDIEEKALVTERIMMAEADTENYFDPEVNIKVENIEVELDFNDFTNNDDMQMETTNDDCEEPAVNIEPQNHEAVLLTFENVVTDNTVLNNTEEVSTAPTYLCKICHLVFRSQRTLHTHQKRMHKVFRRSYIHICDYCGMSYDQRNSLLAHLKRKHGPDAEPDDPEDRTCEICSLVFKGMMRLRMHMRRKHDSFQESFKHECSECGLTYDKYRSLIVHMQRKHTRKAKPAAAQWHKCAFCPKAFSKRETYARHIHRKHRISDDLMGQNDEAYWESCKNEAGELICKECPLVFSTVSSLKLHMRRMHNALKDDFRLKCRICNLSYSKVESLKRHVRRKHGEGKTCNICKKHFESREELLAHTHVKVVKECSLCDLIFASQGGLAKHLRCTHKIESPKVVFCNICNEGFHDKRLLKPHLLKVHLKVSYTCRFCNKMFKAKESYRRHVLVKHPTNSISKINMQHCEQCTKTFPDELELSKHVNSVHNNGESTEKSDEMMMIKKEESDSTQFSCTKCTESYQTWEELRLHFEQNHLTVKNTQCQMCGQMVPETDLPKHIKIQHAQLECSYCNFKTNMRVSMTQHMLRHKNAKTINCEYPGCRYKTFYEGAMAKHKRKHQDLGVKLQCTKCPFQTMNKYILKYHEEAHQTGKKRYSCDKCDYATILPANLVQHKYKHSAEKRFKCEVCPFATKYNTSLRFHVKKKHCDLPTQSVS